MSGTAFRKDFHASYGARTGYALGAYAHHFRQFYRVALVAGRLRCWNTYSRTPHRPWVASSTTRTTSWNSPHTDIAVEEPRFQLSRLQRPPIV